MHCLTYLIVEKEPEQKKERVHDGGSQETQMQVDVSPHILVKKRINQIIVGWVCWHDWCWSHQWNS